MAEEQMGWVREEFEGFSMAVRGGRDGLRELAAVVEREKEKVNMIKEDVLADLALLKTDMATFYTETLTATQMSQSSTSIVESQLQTHSKQLSHLQN